MTEKKLMTRINDAKTYLLEKIPQIPDLGIILGSGLGNLADQVEFRTFRFQQFRDIREG
jgi:purine-nucleoside phosphorylase